MTMDAKTIYLGSLYNTHAAERQGLTQMEKQVGTLDAYPQYKALLQRHIETTRAQLGRIEARWRSSAADRPRSRMPRPAPPARWAPCFTSSSRTRP